MMRRVSNGTYAVILMGSSVYCLVQFIRDIPVEPSWLWGFWAYFSGMIWMLKQTIKEK